MRNPFKAVVQSVVPAPGYSTERTTDPEDGESCTGLRSEYIGGDISSYHGTRTEAVRESWRRDDLRREGNERRKRGEV